MGNEHDRRHESHKKHEPTAGPSADDRGPFPIADDDSGKRGSKVQRTRDVHARIVAFQVVGGVGQITINAGADQGVQVGTKGSVLDRKNNSIADFVVDRVEGMAYAKVELTQDQVGAAAGVVLHVTASGDDRDRKDHDHHREEGHEHHHGHHRH